MGGGPLGLLLVQSIRAALPCLALVLVAACGSLHDDGSRDAGGTPTETVGTVALKPLCPQVHALVDALVVSTPSIQRAFSEQMQRLYDAADSEARTALTPLLDAAETLVEAGVGDGFFAARDGIHRGVQAVDAECKAAGSPILHDGPH